MADETLLSGQQGRQYTLINANPIDRGSTSQLFLGEQTAPPAQAGRKVAVKIALTSEDKTFFEKEAEVLSLLGDIVPGAVPELYDANLGVEKPFLVMEYLASARPLADLGQDRAQEYWTEKDAIYWATRYGEVLAALHDVDFAAPDRKLGDLLLVEQATPTGNNLDAVNHASEDGTRLVVVDWGGVAKLNPSLAQFDLLLFTQFWYRLMLGGHSLPDIRLGTRSPEHHKRWQELSYGAQQILSRGLSRVTQRQYGGIAELLGDWRELGTLWRQSPEELEQGFEEARQDNAYAKALKHLDIIRLVDHPRWLGHADELDSLLGEIDIANVLIKQIKEAIRRGESLADTNVREPLARGAGEYGDDPEWKLLAHRWQLLAEFSSSLADAAHQVFRNEVVGPWTQAVEAMQEENWEEALDLFWRPIYRLVSPSLERPELEGKVIQARELLRAGKRIEAQEQIKAVVEELVQLESTAASAAGNIVDNAFLPKYSRLGGILSLLIETELRNHMLKLGTLLSLGREEEVYASSSALRRLQGQLSYTSLLEEAGIVWPQEILKSLDQQLEVCKKVDEVLAEAAELSDQGKFEQARWILDTTDRQFDYFEPSDPDSAQSLISEVNSVTQMRRQQLKTELKKVGALIQAEQLLTQSTRSDDLSQVLAALEAAYKVLDNDYIKERAVALMGQVNHILQSGPALVSLKTTLEEEEKQKHTPKGDAE